MDLNIEYTALKEQHRFINKALFLIGCYPSKDNYPNVNHEYPCELLDYLGNNTLVFLIDPMYKIHQSRTFTQNLEVCNSNVFIILPFASDELKYDISEIPKFILSFIGLDTPFEVLSSCGISYDDLQDYNVLYQPIKYKSSCYLDVSDTIIFPIKSDTGFVNKTKNVVDFIFSKVEVTEYSQDAYFIFSYLFEQYSSWLRREMMLQKNGHFEFGPQHKRISLKSMTFQPNEFRKIYEGLKFHMYVLDNIPYKTFYEKFRHLVEKGFELFGEKVEIIDMITLVKSSNILQEKLNRTHIIN